MLLIDMDHQGNSKKNSRIDKYDIKKSVYDILMNSADPDDVIIKSTTGNYDLIPGNADLTVAEFRLLEFLARESRLKNAVDKIRDRYDYIFIDCPPALNLLTVNALCAADSVLIPMQCEYFALEGIADL